MVKLRGALARVAGGVAVMAVTFVLGVSWRDLRAVHSVATLGLAVQQIPDRLGEALTAARADEDDYSPFQTYSDVLTDLRTSYYGKEIDPTQMTYNAIRGMMGSLGDRYTRFMDPPAYKSFSEDTTGQFVGIGAQLAMNTAGQTYVVRVLPGGPALQYRVMAGDIILKVNGQSTLKLKDTDVVKLIRGEPNTKVTLTLLRKTPAPSRIVTITMPRELVQQVVVQWTVIDPASRIGYLSLSVFDAESDVQVEKALDDLQAHRIKGLILDLRDNPGGRVDIAQRIASRFIPSGPIVWTKDRSGPMQSLNVETDLHADHMRYPLVVLVNQDSASAAEIVSGAIKDTDSGILVGTQTFGKGLVQTIIPLEDGSAVAITTQHYFTAHLHDINHKGITPNVVVVLTDSDKRAMSAYLRSNPAAPYDLKDDRQLQAALRQLKQRMQLASAAPWN
jgi:carboxyl-terminal processing protease